VQTGKERVTLKGHKDVVRSVTYSPDGKTLASGSADQTIKLWDVQTGKEQATVQAKSMIAVAYSPDGKTLALGNADQTIKLWDLPTAKQADK
jgi:tricorn protease-like protein